MSLLWQPFPMLNGRRAQAWRHQPAYRRPAHFHDQPELNLVTHGSATFVVGTRRVELGPGAVLWYPPGLEHYMAYASADLELFVVGFEPELLDGYGREHGASLDFARPVQHLEPRALRRCADVFAAAPHLQDAASVEAHLLTAVSDIVRETSFHGPKLGHRAAATLARAPALGRDELARRLTSNRGDVSRALRRDHGLSLAQYKNRLRVLKLIRLLDGGHGNLTQAALAAGFQSYSRCHQVIRDLLELPPKALLDPRVRGQLANRFDPWPSDDSVVSSGVEADGGS